jgi:hypothetical protein
MTPTVSSVFKRNIIFVSGKGGVGKTVLSQAAALAHSERGHRTLWCTFEDPTRPLGEAMQVNANLWHLNIEATVAFEEYATMKIGVGPLARIFLQNKLMRYLAKAAPGIHELVLLGKVWHERKNYDFVVVDMPSTGYGVTMFQSTVNFTRLFQGGPINRDAEEMLKTFADPEQSGQLVVALPEEMPLVEGLELNDFLLQLFPKNFPAFLVNRVFPRATEPEKSKDEDPDAWKSPVPASATDYVRKRTIVEDHNLRLWRDKGFPFAELPFFPPPPRHENTEIVRRISPIFGAMQDGNPL